MTRLYDGVITSYSNLPKQSGEKTFRVPYVCASNRTALESGSERILLTSKLLTILLSVQRKVDKGVSVPSIVFHYFVSLFLMHTFFFISQ